MNETLNSFKTKDQFNLNGKTYNFYNLNKLKEQGFQIEHLPFSLKILLENLLRHEDNLAVQTDDIKALCNWDPKAKPEKEINFTPSRVILQDFTGVPAVADLAAMRNAMEELGGDPQKINPLLPAELVIDHSVQVDSFGSPDSFKINARKEFERNEERYQFLRWGQKAFKNFQVVPPDTGIVHQVNIEYLARVVFQKTEGDQNLAYPDTLVGTDSHTTMVNGLGVLGWGVGGIEAEAAMLGQPITMLIPQVVGVRLKGKLGEGLTATDLVLTITEELRKLGVVGKFVEFFGDGLDELSLADRATISNMSPEFGSTAAIFPIDKLTLDYLKLTGRSEEQIQLVETYCKSQDFFRTSNSKDATYSEILEIDLSQIEPSLSGPKRPQDRVPLKASKALFDKTLSSMTEGQNFTSPASVKGEDFELKNGDVVIAAITSCTNTSNPSVLIAAGLLAQKAVQKGLQTKPWVKTSLAPGSKVVIQYLEKAGLLDSLEKLKFHNVGYGCTTCIGNSGPLPNAIHDAIHENNLLAVSVLSGNRNFEGRISPDVRANYLASPPLVVAYALAGKMDWDPYSEAIGQDTQGNDVFLKDIWPSANEVREALAQAVNSEMFQKEYANVFEGDSQWRNLQTAEGDLFDWDESSTYIQRPAFFTGMTKNPEALSDIQKARCLAVLGDSVTTDHISPAGSIAEDSPAGDYLQKRKVDPENFNSYGSRRGNHEVMVRGTFANIRLRNLLAPGTEGGMTRKLPEGDQTTIYEASRRYQHEGIPLIVIAGKEYGSGSSRDWAAKGTRMLGIKAVIAESYERIHRSNLIGMGVLPLQFLEDQNQESLGLSGEEEFTIEGIANDLKPAKVLSIKAKADDGSEKSFEAMVRIDTPVELEYYKHGGILSYVLRQLL